MSTNVALFIFVVTYLGIALGEIPGLAVDRTGFALLGAIAMVATGVLTLRDALHAVDVPTMLLLYALMVLSAQLRLSGLYTWIALRLTRLMERPRRFLLILMAVAGGLSALLVNDIICLAFTPVLVVSLIRGGLNPLPFLIGLAVSSNIGSAATIIGNPQNMLIGQVGGLHFGRFLLFCAPPAVASLLASYAVILLVYRGRFVQALDVELPMLPAWPELNAHQSRKGIVAVLALIALFFTHIPREISAITLAGLLLCSRRMQTRWILDLIDWPLLTLFVGLFVVIRGLATTHLPEQTLQVLQQHGVDLLHLPVLTVVATLLSNLVSNVPAAMLLVHFLNPADPTPWYVLALASTFAGNLITIGSIANLIVIEQARELNVDIRFREHARVGIPVTVLSLVITIAWVRLHAVLF